MWATQPNLVHLIMSIGNEHQGSSAAGTPVSESRSHFPQTCSRLGQKASCQGAKAATSDVKKTNSFVKGKKLICRRMEHQKETPIKRNDILNKV